MKKKKEKSDTQKTHGKPKSGLEDGLVILGLKTNTDETYISADHFASKFKRCTLFKDTAITYSFTTPVLEDK